MVIGSVIHTSIYNKRNNFRFSIVNFPLLSGDVTVYTLYTRKYLTVFTFFSLLDLLGVVLAFWISIRQITSKLLTKEYKYITRFKTIGKFFKSCSELLSTLGDILYQEYVSKGITHSVCYGDLQTRVKGTVNCISPGSKIVKRLRRRQYGLWIMEGTIQVLCLAHIYSLV